MKDYAERQQPLIDYAYFAKHIKEPSELFPQHGKI
jgi:hypothetical protein